MFRENLNKKDTITLSICVKIVEKTADIIRRTKGVVAFNSDGPIILDLLVHLTETSVFQAFLKEANRCPEANTHPFFESKPTLNILKALDNVASTQKNALAYTSVDTATGSRYFQGFDLGNFIHAPYFEEAAMVFNQEYSKIVNHYLIDLANTNFGEVDNILTIFRDYINKPTRMMNTLKVEFSKYISTGGYTLLTILTNYPSTREIFLRHAEYANQLTKKSLLKSSCNGEENAGAFVNLMGDCSNEREKDTFSIRFFTANPHILSWLTKETFTTPMQRYVTQSTLRDGTSTFRVMSMAEMLIVHRMDEILKLHPPLYSYYDIDFISKPETFYTLLMNDFFIRHPDQIPKIKHAALIQKVHDFPNGIESLFISTRAKYRNFRRLFCIYPGLINEFSPTYAKEIKQIHHEYFKKHDVNFSESHIKTSKVSANAASEPQMELSAGETKLKNCLLIKGYTHAVDVSELQDNRFTLSLIDQVYTIHVKLSDDQTINMVANARKDHQKLSELATIHENRAKDDYWLEISGNDVEKLLLFINAVFDNDIQELRHALQAHGFRAANLSDQPVAGFHLQAVNENTAYQITFFYTTEVINKIAKAQQQGKNGIHVLERPKVAKGGREKYRLQAKKINWLNFLKNQGDTFKIETRVAVAPKQNLAPAAPKIELNQDAWRASIKEALYQLDKLVISIENGRIEIAMPPLNHFYSLQLNADPRENLFVSERYVHTFVANLKTLLPDNTKIEIDNHHYLNTITFRTKLIEPKSNDVVLKVHYANIQKCNQDNLQQLLEESFKIDIWKNFLLASFSYAKDLEVSFHWDKQVYFQVNYPHHNPVWCIKDTNGYYKEVYVSESTLQKEVLSRLQTNLAEVSTEILMFQGSVKIYTHVPSINKTAHEEICTALEKAHNEREVFILKKRQKSTNACTTASHFLGITLAKEKSQKQKSKDLRKDEIANSHAASALAKKQVAAQAGSVPMLERLKQFIIQTIGIMNAAQVAAFSEQKGELWYDLDHAAAFGCLSAKQVLRIALEVINANISSKLLRQLKTIPLQLLSLTENAGQVCITTAVDLTEHFADLEDESSALTAEFTIRYHQAVHTFIQARHKDCILAPSCVAEDPSAVISNSALKSHSFFVAFFNALLSISDITKELLKLHADNFLQFENYSVEDKNYEFYQYIARGNLIRLLALLDYLTKHPQVELFRDFARHTLNGEIWEQFKGLTQALVSMMQLFFSEIPKPNELCVPVFQKLFESHANKIAETLTSFAHRSDKQRYKEKVKHRADHETLKKVITALQGSDLNHEVIRDGVIGILSDIGESVTQGFINHSADKTFLQLCKDIYVNFGHYEFNRPYTDFIKEQYALFLNYQVKSKMAAALFSSSNTPKESLNPNAKVFIPRTPNGI